MICFILIVLVADVPHDAKGSQPIDPIKAELEGVEVPKEIVAGMQEALPEAREAGSSSSAHNKGKRTLSGEKV